MPITRCYFKIFPKNFSMVFAFAGDSTITKFFAMYLSVFIISASKKSPSSLNLNDDVFFDKKNFLIKFSMTLT